MEYNYAFLILLLPFLSFLVLGLVGMKMKRPVAALIGTVLMGCVFAMSVYTAYEYFFAVGRDASTGMYPTVTVFNFTWLKFTELLTFNIGFRLSPISVLMLIVITTVSFMVHIYSFGYMAERDENYKVEEYEKGMQRFYAYLSLFTMSMLGLVVATNIFQMYLFWELVGVCSYLLIGFYYPKHAAVHASKKAFIVTRFADLFFLIGILFYSFYVGTFNYDLNAQPELNSALAGAAWVMPTALFLMFIGGAGKSAMFPLHIWLPDAMEGPTPVSALIHAATMVVAGVYQVASLFPIWVQYAPETLHYVAYIAAFTAFYAAAVACCQRDIKRGLAFSTISQIAYMLVALGNHLVNSLLRIDVLVLLVNISQLHGLTHLECAAICLIQAHNEAEEGSLAGSVRTDHTYDAVRRKHEVEVVEENLFAERLLYMLSLNHLVAQARTVRDEDFQLLLALLLLLVEHLLVRVQTSLTLSLTGLRRHANPFQLALQCLAAFRGSLLLLNHSLGLLVEP